MNNRKSKSDVPVHLIVIINQSKLDMMDITKFECKLLLMQLLPSATSKVLEVHEKSDLVPAPVHKNKFDCVPRSNQETCMKCFYWKFTKNMIEFPFPLMRYELVRELSFIDCVLPIP